MQTDFNTSKYLTDPFYLMLVREVSDEAVGVVILGMVEGKKLAEVVPIPVVLVSHVVTNTEAKQMI